MSFIKSCKHRISRTQQSRPISSSLPQGEVDDNASPLEASQMSGHLISACSPKPLRLLDTISLPDAEIFQHGAKPSGKWSAGGKQIEEIKK